MGVEELWKKLIFDGMEDGKWKALLIKSAAFSLLYDLNGTLYDVAHDVYGIGPALDGTELSRRKDIAQIRRKFKDNPEELHGKFFSKLRDVLTSNVIDVVNASDVLIMGLDGNVPGPKLDQQRTRRNIAAEERANRERTQTDLGELDTDPYMFNTINFTPGTPFMKRVCTTIHEWVSDNRTRLPALIYFSDCSERGEAEHKIFKIFEILIGQLDAAFKDEAKVLPSTVFAKNIHVIMGLDSDLCFITMLRTDYSFYWVRDAKSAFKQKGRQLTRHSKFKERDEEMEEDGLITTSITNVRDFIVESMGGDKTNKEEVFQIVVDFVLLSFHIGDDFVPPIFTLTIDIGLALIEMMKVYKDNMEGMRLAPDGTINLTNLCLYYMQFEDSEKGLYELKVEAQNVEIEYEEKVNEGIDTTEIEKRRNEIRDILKRNHKFKFDYTSILELSFDEFIENWPKFIVCPSLALNNQVSERMSRYQELVTENCEEDLEKICDNYLTGLQWNLYYYMGGDVNDWMYEWSFAPTMTHLSKFLQSKIVEVNDQPVVKYNLGNTMRRLADNYIDPTKTIFTAMNIILSKKIVNEIMATGKKTTPSEKTLLKDVAPGKLIEKIPFYMSYVPVSFARFYGGKYYDSTRSRHGGYSLVPKIPMEVVFKIGVNPNILLNYPGGKIKNIDDDIRFDQDFSGNSTLINAMRGGKITFGVNDVEEIEKRKKKKKKRNNGESDGEKSDSEDRKPRTDRKPRDNKDRKPRENKDGQPREERKSYDNKKPKEKKQTKYEKREVLVQEEEKRPFGAVMYRRSIRRKEVSDYDI